MAARAVLSSTFAHKGAGLGRVLLIVMDPASASRLDLATSVLETTMVATSASLGPFRTSSMPNFAPVVLQARTLQVKAPRNAACAHLKLFRGLQDPLTAALATPSTTVATVPIRLKSLMVSSTVYY
jgi:hypothetical protein